MGLYLNNGYLNVRYCKNFKCPFTFIIGGRATGKTFGSIKADIEDGKTFMLMRRTQSQADLIAKPDFSPVNPVLDYMGRVGKIESATRYNGVIFSAPNPDSEEWTLHGYTAALSTFSNLRGFSGDSIEELILDEFIPERHERPIKAEADAFFNVYESINRNRELLGRDPLQAVLLSNSNSLASPILEALGLIKIIERMQRNEQSEYINKIRGIAIFLLNYSPISDLKRQTALYKATAGTDFSRMALNNDFAFDDMSDVKSLPLSSGWKLFARLGEMYFYRDRDLWYISRHCAGEPGIQYEMTDIGVQKWVHDFPGSYQRILNHKIIYEDFGIKSAFTNLFI